MKIEKMKEKIAAAGTLLLLTPKTVFASEIQEAIESADVSSFESLESFFQWVIDTTEGWIGYFGAFAFIAGILICLATAPTKKLRGLGYGCLAAAFGAIVIWLLLPALLTAMSGGGA